MKITHKPNWLALDNVDLKVVREPNGDIRLEVFTQTVADAENGPCPDDIPQSLGKAIISGDTIKAG